LSNSDLTSGNGNAPVIGIPIELNKKLVIEPLISFNSYGRFNGTVVEDRTIFGLGGKVLFRLSEKETHPYVGGSLAYSPQSITIENNGTDLEQTSSTFGVGGIFGIEHNISNQFTFAIEGSIGFTSNSDIEIEGTKVVDGYTNIGLGISAIFRMFLD